MRTLLTRIAPLALSLGLFLPVALAEDPPKAPPPPDLGDLTFHAMDKNGDGRVSEDEHAAASKTMFETMDTNKDGKVTAEEMTVAAEKLTGKKSMPSGLTAAEKIKGWDKDGDGALSAAEHAAGVQARFKVIDHDMDHYLSADEAAGARLKMGMPPKAPPAPPPSPEK